MHSIVFRRTPITIIEGSEAMNVDELIKTLGLQPHPEGGYFRETYRSNGVLTASALPTRYGGDRAFGTAIYYLLTADTFSVMHRLASDEVYHFYLGDPVEMLLLQPDGSSQQVVLGHDVTAGQHVQMVVPRMWWQGSRVRTGGRFALLGCTMAPGFDFADFEEGKRADLETSYPDAKELIGALTRL
jgi:predicted cupin superfamily sugar epimerase